MTASSEILNFANGRDVTASVVEGVAVDTAIYTFAAAILDGDVSADITYALEITGDYAEFTFDASTRELRFINPPQERVKPYQITISATSGNVVISQTLTLTVVDDDADAPEFSSAATAMVAEGSATSFYTAVAVADVASSGVTYGLSGGGDYAEINAESGEVTLKSGFDFDKLAGDGFDITITATDNTDPTRISTQLVTVTVMDINDEAPVAKVNAISIDDGENVGTAIVITLAHFGITDADKMAADPSLVIITVTKAAIGATLSKGEKPLNTADSFTLADLNNGLIKLTITDALNYKNFKFTVFDGVKTSDEQSFDLSINDKVDYSSKDPAQSYVIDTGDGIDTIIGSDGDDIIDGGKGLDKITPGVGADTIVYEFGSDSSGFSGHDGTTVVKGFNRGVDKLRFVTQDNSGDYATVEKFWATSLLADKPMFLPQVLYHFEENEDTDGDVVVVKGVTFTFRKSGVFSGERIARGSFSIEFAEDEWMTDVDFIAAIGGLQNYDSSLKTITSLNGLEAYLGGAGSVEYVASSILITDVVTSVAEGLVTIGVDIARVAVVNDDALKLSIDDDRFEIIGTTLRLKAGTVLDSADGEAITVLITATKEGSAGLAKKVTVNINVDAVFVGDVVEYIVPENTIGVVFTALATDVNLGDTVSYRLKANAGDNDKFIIDTVSGGVSFAVGAANFEGDGPIYRAIVEAVSTAGDGSTQVIERVYTVTLTDVIDEELGFISSGAADPLPENVMVAKTAPIYTANAVGDARAQIFYRLEGGDSAAFRIDEISGVVTFAEATTPNFEDKSSYSFTIRATAGVLSAIETVVIAVVDINDAPTLVLMGNALVPDATDVGVAVAIDTDNAEKTSFAYALSGTNNDNGAFSIDTNTGALTFTGGAEARKMGGGVYEIEITVTDTHADSNTVAVIQSFQIIAGGIFAESPDASGRTISSRSPDASSRKIYSNDPDGVFDEETIQEIPTVIGSLGFEGSDDATFALADGNTEFTIIEGVLSYIGGAVGDYEAVGRGVKIITILVDLDGSGDGTAIAYQYAVTLADTDDKPIFADGLVGAVTGDVDDTASGTIIITDVDTKPAFKTVTLTPQSDRDGVYGTIVFEGNEWTYTLDSSLRAVKTLGSGATLTDVFVVTVDGAATASGAATTAEIIITINGANDRPSMRVFAPIGDVDEDAVGAEISGIRFAADDIDSIDQDTITASNFVIMDEDGAVSTLFEAYRISLIDAADPIFGLRLIAGQVLDYDGDDGKASHVLNIVYDDQSGADNAVSAPRILTVNVNNFNDSPPVFMSDGIAAPLAENIEITADTPIYTTVAVADGGGDLTYTIEGGDSALFDIDANGVVTFKTATTLDFEAFNIENGASYSFTVRIVADTVQTATQDVTIAIIDGNDAPTGLMISGAVLAPAATNAGVVSVIDADDPGKTTFAFSLTLSGADNGLFSIDADTGVLTFIGEDAARKANGRYNIEVMVEDSHSASDGGITTQTITESFDVIAGGVFVQLSASRKIYSNDLMGIFDEHSTPQNPTQIGVLGFEGAPLASFALGNNPVGGANAKYAINGDTGVLSYIGGTVGDYESAGRGADTITVLVDANDDGTAVEYEYIITIRDVDDNAPIFTEGLSGTVDAASDATTTGTLVITDADAEPAFQTTSLIPPSGSGLMGIYGAIAFNGNDWVYTLNGSMSQIQTLGRGETLTDVFTVSVDGSAETAEITITINGANDRPSFTTVRNIGNIDEGVADADVGKNVRSILFEADDLDASDKAAINAANFIVMDGGAVSTLFTAYHISGTGAGALFGLRLIAGQELDFEGSPENPAKTLYELSIIYDDQSGADNAQSDAQTFIVNVNNLNETPIFTSVPGVLELRENINVLAITPLYRATATSDTGAQIVYSLEGADAELFTISDAGEVTFINPTTPDFEVKDSYAFTVRATAAAKFADQDVVITVVDGNDAPTTLTLWGTAVAPANSRHPTHIGRVTARDDIDRPEDTTFAYSFTGTDNDNALFALDETTGVLTFAGEANDRIAAGEYYDIEVTVSDRHSDGTTETLTEEFQLISGGIYVNSLSGDAIYSNSPDGLFSEGVGASDANTVLFLTGTIMFEGFTDATFESVDDPNYRLFGGTILAVKGRSLYDYEAPDHDTHILTFMVDLDGAGDVYTAAPYQYIVNIRDINENRVTDDGIEHAPTVDQTTGISGTITEGGDLISGQIIIHDEDDGKPTPAINQNTIIPTAETEAIAAFSVIDRDIELKEDYMIQLDHGRVVFNSVTNEWIYTLNPNTELNLGDVLEDSFSLSVIYNLNDAEGNKAVVQIVTITINGANDRPTAAITTGQGNIDEGLVGAEVAGIRFTVDDDDPSDKTAISAANFIIMENGEISTLFTAYHVSGIGADSIFGLQLIDGQTLDFETAETHSITAIYDDQSGEENAEAAAIALTINVNNLNDSPPIFTSINEGAVLVENTPVDIATIIYTAAAISDGGNGGAIVYTLEGQNAELYNINASTGAVTFVSTTTPDFETTPLYSFTVRATIGDQSADITVTINVGNVNDDPILVLRGNALTPDAVFIGTAAVLDAPAETSQSFSIGGDGADDHLFSIDQDTGVLTFIGGSADRKAGGESYTVEIIGSYIYKTGRGMAITEEFEVVVGGIYIQESEGRKIYSSDPMGILDEHSTPTTPLALGTLGFEGSDDATFTIASGGRENEFIITNGVLNYIGGTVGDYESAEQGVKLLNILVDLDGDGGEEAISYQYIITLTDIDDAATFGGGLDGMVDAGGDGVITGTVVITDVDVNPAFRDITLVPQADRDGRYGTITFNGNEWTYTLDTDRYAVQELGLGATLTDRFTVAVNSIGAETTADITITINGANDRPTIRIYAPLGDISENRDGAEVAGIRFTATDIDVGTAISAGNFNVMDEENTASTLFEAYIVSAEDAIFGIKMIDDQSLDYDTASSHRLSITYDDQSGADNAVSEARILTVNVGKVVTPLFTLPTTTLNGGADVDTIDGSELAELLQGGAGDDVFDNNAGGGDVIIGGHGADTITLAAAAADAADTLVYRFESDSDVAGTWAATDGGDTIHNFRYGVDRLVLVDVSKDENPIDSLAEFIADADKPQIEITYDDAGTRITSLALIFDGGTELTIGLIGNPALTADDQQKHFTSGDLMDYAFLDDIFGGSDSFIIGEAADLPDGLVII